MPYQDFKQLRVWCEARDLAIEIYRVTKTGNLARDFGLKDQMQRAAVSIGSNIAEGYERHSNKDFQRFLFIAKGSLSELRTQLEIAHAIELLSQNDFSRLDDHCTRIGAMLTKLIRARASGP